MEKCCWSFEIPASSLIFFIIKQNWVVTNWGSGWCGSPRSWNPSPLRAAIPGAVPGSPNALSSLGAGDVCGSPPQLTSAAALSSAGSCEIDGAKSPKPGGHQLALAAACGCCRVSALLLETSGCASAAGESCLWAPERSNQTIVPQIFEKQTDFYTLCLLQ